MSADVVPLAGWRQTPFGTLADGEAVILTEDGERVIGDIYLMLAAQEARHERRQARAALALGWGLAAALVLLALWGSGWRPPARLVTLAARAAEVTARQCSDFVASVEAFLRTEGY